MVEAIFLLQLSPYLPMQHKKKIDFSGWSERDAADKGPDSRTLRVGRKDHSRKHRRRLPQRWYKPVLALELFQALLVRC